MAAALFLIFDVFRRALPQSRSPRMHSTTNAAAGTTSSGSSFPLAPDNAPAKLATATPRPPPMLAIPELRFTFRIPAMRWCPTLLQAMRPRWSWRSGRCRQSAPAPRYVTCCLLHKHPKRATVPAHASCHLIRN